MSQFILNKKTVIPRLTMDLRQYTETLGQEEWLRQINLIWSVYENYKFLYGSYGSITIKQGYCIQ